jgi:hypothetical protein
MLLTRMSDRTFKNVIRSKERVGRPSWSTISRPRTSAAQFLSIRKQRDRRSGSGWPGPFSRSKAAIGACRSSAAATRSRPGTRDALPRSDPISPKSSIWPESLPRRPHLETLGAGAGQFGRHRHRRNGPRKASERPPPRSTGRRFQPRPGSSGGPRSRQQSPTAAADFGCFTCRARQRSGLCANRRRSGGSALASGRGDARHGVRQRFVQHQSRDPSLDRSEVAAAPGNNAILRRIRPDRRGGETGRETGFGRRDRRGGVFPGGEPRDCPQPVESSLCQNEHPPPS